MKWIQKCKEYSPYYTFKKYKLKKAKDYGYGQAMGLFII